MKNRHRPPEIRAYSFDESASSSTTQNLLTSDQQALIQSVSTLVQFERGENTIFLEGEEGAFVYILAKGITRTSRVGASGRRQVMHLNMSGDIFGFPEHGLYVNTATALGEVMLHRIAWQRLKELIRMDPQLQSTLLTRMAHDLRRAQKRIMVLGQQNVAQRLASFILDLMENRDFYKPELRQLYLPLSRFDLGDYLGTSPETVVRSMAKMEEDGIICRLSSRLLLIPDPRLLEDLPRGRRRKD